MIRRHDLKRVVDARVKRCIGVSSDHLPILLKIRVAAKLARTHTRDAKLPMRKHLLRIPAVRQEFQEVVRLSLSDVSPADLSANEIFESLKAAVKKAGEGIRGRDRESPHWFSQNQEILAPLFQARQAAKKLLDENPLNATFKSMYAKHVI
jgi:hypothetical protein